MCGVTGFVSQQIVTREGESRLTEMLRRIIHRGPDAEGRLLKPEYGLYAGMRRLAVIDLASGDQPIWNEDRANAVLFNGEIYNYRELRSKLIKRNHHFRTESDTEVLVHLYEEYADEMSRPKQGFPIPLNEWLKGSLRPIIEDLVLSDSAQNRQALDGKLLRGVWDDFVAGNWQGTYIFYSLLLYEIWHSQMVQCEASN